MDFIWAQWLMGEDYSGVLQCRKKRKTPDVGQQVFHKSVS